MSKVSDPQHWRRRAEEARTLADELTVADAKRKMLKIAEDYEAQARRAERRLRAATNSTRSEAASVEQDLFLLVVGLDLLLLLHDGLIGPARRRMEHRAVRISVA
jgi:hypothetical protein